VPLEKMKRKMATMNALKCKHPENEVKMHFTYLQQCSAHSNSTSKDLVILLLQVHHQNMYLVIHRRRKKDLPTAQETSFDVSWAFFCSPCLPFIVSPSSPHCSVSQLPPVSLFVVVPFGLVVALVLSHRFAVVPIPTS